MCSELEPVSILKESGNIKFKEKKYDEAEKLYTDSLLKLEEVRSSVPKSQKNNLVQLETSILLNLSNIKSHNKDYPGLLQLAKEVVLMSPESGKGYFRYAQALHHLGKSEAALEKIKQAEKYSSYSESKLSTHLQSENSRRSCWKSWESQRRTTRR